MSNRYAPDGPGDKRATKMLTKRSNDAIQSKASKKHHSSDYFLKWKYEAGFASNRWSGRIGECGNITSTYRPSHQGSTSGWRSSGVSLKIYRSYFKTNFKILSIIDLIRNRSRDAITLA